MAVDEPITEAALVDQSAAPDPTTVTDDALCRIAATTGDIAPPAETSSPAR